MKDSHTTILIILLALSSLPAAGADQVQIVRDIAFLGPNRKEKLDLYLPPKTNRLQTRPAILIVHGGGWHGGSKSARREQNIGNHLAGAGFVCASVNYVLAERKTRFTDNLRQVWPRNLQDCMAGVRWLRLNAGKYWIDSERIGAIGGSAGGHLVAMLAYADEADGLDSELPHAGHSSRIQAVVPMYGVHDLITHADDRDILADMSEADRKLCRAASPVTYIDKDDPPALILHGTKDALVPVRQSRLLHDALQKSGVGSEIVVIPDAPHSFHLQPKQRDLRETVISFFNRHLRRSR